MIVAVKKIINKKLCTFHEATSDIKDYFDGFSLLRVLRTYYIRAPIESVICMTYIVAVVESVSVHSNLTEYLINVINRLIAIMIPSATIIFVFIFFCFRETIRLLRDIIRSEDTLQKKINHLIRKSYIKVHIVAVLSFLVTGVISSVVYDLKYKGGIGWPEWNYIIGSVIMGICINIFGYNTHRTVKWEKLYLPILLDSEFEQDIDGKVYIQRVKNYVVVLIFYVGYITAFALATVIIARHIVEVEQNVEICLLLLTLLTASVIFYLKFCFDTYIYDKNTDRLHFTSKDLLWIE